MPGVRTYCKNRDAVGAGAKYVRGGDDRAVGLLVVVADGGGEVVLVGAAKPPTDRLTLAQPEPPLACLQLLPPGNRPLP